MRILKAVFILLVLTVIFPNPPHHLYAFTFYVAGETVYYYLVGSSCLFEYTNQSNKQEIYKYLSDGTIIGKNTAVMKNFYGQLPWPYQGNETLSINKYYTDEKSNKYMNDVTMQMVKAAASLDEAVDNISIWLRQNVTYSLGTSTDPVSVYKTKRTYCEGYKNLAVELFSQAGIPASGITCYIPPGHGWGFGSSGGNHAFARYYYPGCGWVCLDPQSTLNYADPYHLINFLRSNFVKDLKVIDNSYVIDYQEEPKSWETFTACGKKAILHPVLIFKIIDIKGAHLQLPLFSFTSQIAELNIIAYSRKGFWSDVGLHVNQYANGFSAVTSPYSPYNSFILTQPGAAELKSRDIMAVKTDSCLFIREYDFNGNGNYFFEADFQKDADIKTVFLFNAEGKALVRQQVEIETSRGKYSLVSADDGSLALKIPDESIRLILDNTAYTVVFGENRFQYVPAKPDFLQQTTAFLAAGKAGENKPALLCTLFDKYGRISADLSETLQIYTEKARPVTVKKTDGLLFYDNFQLDRDYYILVNSGNIYFRRKIRFNKNEIRRFEFSQIPADNAVSLSFENSLDESLVFHEYLAASVFAYPAKDGKIYLDFPEGLYLFADNNKKERIIPVAVPGRKEELVYVYAHLDFADFLTVNKLLYNTETGLAGAVEIAPSTISAYQFEQYMGRLEKADDREFLSRVYKKSREWADDYTLDDKAAGAERRRIAELTGARCPGAELALVNLASGKIDKITADSAGYFFFPAQAANTQYLLCYAVNEDNTRSVLYTKHFRTGEKELCIVNLEAYGEPVVIRHSSKKNSYYYTPPLCYLLFPRLAADKLAAGCLELKMNNKGSTTLFTDTGTLIFSADKSLFSARLVSAENQAGEYVLDNQPETGENMAAQAAVFNSFYQADRCLLLIRAADKSGAALANKQAVLYTDSGEKKFTTDKNGYAVVEGLQEGSVCHFRYAGNGLYADYPLPPVHPGVNTVPVNLKNAACYTFAAGKTTGNFELCFPKIVKEQLALDSAKLLFDKNNMLELYLEPGTYFFKAGADKILVDYTFDKTARYQLDFKAARDALPSLQKLLAMLLDGKPAYIIRLTDNNKPLVNYTAEILDGKRKTAYKVQKDGLFYITKPASGELRLEYKAEGVFTRTILPAASAPLTCIIDIKKQAALVVTLTGKSTAIRSRTLYLYAGASPGGQEKLKYGEKLPVKTDAAGQAHIILPDGKYYLEVNAGSYEAVEIQAGKVKRISVKIG